MKFLSPNQPSLQVHGAGRFTDGRLELADADAVSIARVRAIAPHWGIKEVATWPEPDVDAAEIPDTPELFDPRGVNLDGEGGVLEHLAAADDAERVRIIALEQQSPRPRKSVLEYGADDSDAGPADQTVDGDDVTLDPPAA